MYKAPLTATVFKDFSACYKHFSSQSSKNGPYVYVDSSGVKLLTNIVDEKDINSEGIFALSVAEDGFVEMLAIH